MKSRIGYGAKKLIEAVEDRISQLIKLNSQLTQLTRCNFYWDALRLFVRIHSTEKLRPDQYTLSSSLTACAKLGNVDVGEQIHGYGVKAGVGFFRHVGNTLLLVYSKAGDLEAVKRVFGEIGSPDGYTWTTMLCGLMGMGEWDDARRVFDEMPERSVAVWNAMVTGCADGGDFEGAVWYFLKMHRLGVGCDNYSVASVLSLCGDFGVFGLGNQVHSLALKSGNLSKVSVFNVLLTMYFTCRDVVGGRKVFAEAKDAGRDCITYNAMISGFVRESMHEEALSVLTEMLAAGVSPNELTFVTVMSTCECAEVGCNLQAKAIKMGFEAYTSVNNATITMYSSIGELRGAELIFERLEERDLISWNAMISSYAEGGFERSAFLTFLQMQEGGVAADKFTVGSLLMSTDFLETVAVIHALVFKNGLLMKTEVSNTLISSYSKQERVDKAHQVFREMLYQNLISWNAIISGFVFNGYPLVGLALFSELLTSKLSPDVGTITHVVNSCACISAFNYGRQVHNFIIRFEFMSESCLGNALISLYAKCGNLDWSIRVFNVMIQKDVVSWNSLISAFAQHGKGKEAVLCFKAMQDPINAIRPDTTTFTALLSACSHAGLVEDALNILDTMVTSYNIIPETDHLSCTVDLLGRAGYLDEAEKFGFVQAHPNIWWALFSACVAHGDLRLGRIVAEYLLEADKTDPSVYVQVSNIYAMAGQWNEATNIREFMRTNGVSKQLGWSSVSF